PSDQRISVSLLFQDEMPANPDYKVLLSLFYGSGLPYGPPTMNRYDDVLRTPAYRRVDLGFSKELLSSDKHHGKNGFISIEVFNILGINNTINHTWIEDVNGRLYAIPNFLTGRRLNLKLHLEF
ncbi:MAG: TonB-dependent receptor, partial [Flavobacteriales bacterium]